MIVWVASCGDSSIWMTGHLDGAVWVALKPSIRMAEQHRARDKRECDGQDFKEMHLHHLLSRG